MLIANEDGASYKRSKRIYNQNIIITQSFIFTKVILKLNDLLLDYYNYKNADYDRPTCSPESKTQVPKLSVQSINGGRHAIASVPIRV